MDTMTDTNKYDWPELKSYLEGYIDTQVKKVTDEPDWMKEVGWTEQDARNNAVQNLQQSLTIMFPVELIDLKI